MPKFQISPHTKVRDLASNPLLDDLTHSAILVWLRVVAATATQGSHVRITNVDLHKVPRTAQRALVELSAKCLLRVHVNDIDNSRVIEVL